MTLPFSTLRRITMLSLPLLFALPDQRVKQRAEQRAEQRAGLRAGAAVVEITPKIWPVLVNGGFLSRQGKSMKSKLHARALVLDDGKTKLAIVIIDSCMMPRELFDPAKAEVEKRTGIPASNILMAATHTHAAPSSFGCLGTGPDKRYVQFVRPLIVQSVVDAHARLEPAQVGAAVIHADKYTALRRWVLRPGRMRTDPFGEKTVRATMHAAGNSDDATGPTGPEDPDFSILAVQARDGRPIALIGNFANHYVPSPLVGSGYFGMFATQIEERLGRGVVGAMSQGTSGDVWLRDYFTPPPRKLLTIGEYTRDMVELAETAYKSIQFRHDITLAAAATELTLEYRTPDARRLAWAKALVVKMGDRLPRSRPEVYAKEALILDEKRRTRIVLQALRIGDIGITALPNEVYALTGLKLKALSPLETTINIELANGADGYIPPPEQHYLGGYTTWPARSAGLEAQAEPKITEALTRLLEKVSGKTRRVVKQSIGPASQAVLDSKPLAYWRLDEWSATGGAHDQMGRSLGKYEPGVVFYLEGPGARQFNGDTQINRAAHFAGGRVAARVAGLGDTYTAELWFWNGLATRVRPITGYLFSRGVDGARTNSGDHVGIGGTSRDVAAGKLFFYNGDVQAEVLKGKTSIRRWRWHHLVMVRDKTACRIYLDGKLEISGTATMTVPKGRDLSLFLGGRVDNFANFEGRIDEAAVYDRALSAAEIAAHFAAAPAPVTKYPPRSPEESLQRLKVRDGYVIELVAAEPMVKDPVAIAWDLEGRLWVVEMADYPLGSDGKPGGRIRVLTDSNRDGKYDQSRVFLDGLNFANGIMPWRDGVLITAAPDILYAEDTDGDGRADKREVLYTGFTQGNQQLRVNGLRYGLDHWIYCANGLGSRDPVMSMRTRKQVSIRGRDFRIRPHTGDIDAQSGPSQFGRVRDDWGNWFGVENSLALFHLVLADQYTRRNPHFSSPNPRRQLVLPRNPPVFFRSPFIKYYEHPHRGSLMTSACGISIYRDELLFDRSRTHAFTCEPYHNLVLHNELDEVGASFKATLDRGANGKTEFLASSDLWFRPVMSRTGPDGALWIVDMYRYVIEHPKFMPPSGKAQLEPFYRSGQDRGRIYRIRKKGRPLRPIQNLHGSNASTLVAALAHPNGIVRDLAQQELIDSKAVGEKPALESLFAESDDPRARLHALCTLGGLGALSKTTLQGAIADPHPGVRRHGWRLAETFTKLAGITVPASEPDLKTRIQFAASLGALGDELWGRQLVGLLRDSDQQPDLYAAIMSSARTHLELLARSPGIDHAVVDLLALAIADKKHALTLTLLRPILTRSAAGYSARQFQQFAAVLDMLERRRVQSSDLIEDGTPESGTLLAGFNAVFAGARANARREPAATALLGRAGQHILADIETLDSFFAPAIGAPVQLAAVRAMARTHRSQASAALIKSWSSVDGPIQVSIINALLPRTSFALDLLKAVADGGIPKNALDATQQQRLRNNKNKRVAKAAARILGAPSSRAEVMARRRPALKLKADDARGKLVFQKLCITCHRLDEVGLEIGPNPKALSDRSPEALLTAILDPNQNVENRYRAFTLVLKNGTALHGVMVSSDTHSITMVGLDGESHRVKRADIVERIDGKRSLMPEGLETAMTDQDLADLIRYLAR